MRQLIQPFRNSGSPHYLTPFLGRDAEYRQLADLLADPACRLLTLVGLGGIGKSRLAFEVARDQRERFADGVVWVDLQSATTEAELISAVADGLALTLSGPAAPGDWLCQALAPQEVLLVLDNVEQLRDAVDLLPLLLHHAPQLRLMATSRMPLQLQEEWLFPLSGLAYPQKEGEISAEIPVESFGAGQLFVTRARQVRPDLVPVRERDAIQRICELVEGLPLALELAAAWARSLDCAAIAEAFARMSQQDNGMARNALDLIFQNYDVDVIASDVGQLYAPAGYPALSVPAGTDEDGMPQGIVFVGGAWSEPALLAVGYAFEQATQARVVAELDATIQSIESIGQ